MRNAVSEVTGYIYIFGIVMAVLAIVFVQVHGMVEDMKRSVLSQSLEQSFKRIEHIVYSVAFGGMPAQSVEIELQGGRISLEKRRPEFIIAFVNDTASISDCSLNNFELYCLNLSTGRIYNSSSCSGLFDKKACTLNKTVGILGYEYGNWMISIEGGAIFSKQSEYSKLLHEPRILVNTTAGTSKYLLMTIPMLEGDFSAEGFGRIKILVKENESYTFSQLENVNIGEGVQWMGKFDRAYVMIRDTEHQDAWCRFFDGFELLNTTLRAENCHNCYGISPCVCTCKRADLPMAMIETKNLNTNIVIIFKSVIFAQQ
ncbi:MAG: hypothetical protein QXU04_05705 [Archaeoglobaceae archaeon]